MGEEGKKGGVLFFAKFMKMPGWSGGWCMKLGTEIDWIKGCEAFPLLEKWSRRRGLERRLP